MSGRVVALPRGFMGCEPVRCPQACDGRHAKIEDRRVGVACCWMCEGPHGEHCGCCPRWKPPAEPVPAEDV